MCTVNSSAIHGLRPQHSTRGPRVELAPNQAVALLRGRKRRDERPPRVTMSCAWLACACRAFSDSLASRSSLPPPVTLASPLRHRRARSPQTNCGLHPVASALSAADQRAVVAYRWLAPLPSAGASPHGAAGTIESGAASASYSIIGEASAPHGRPPAATYASARLLPIDLDKPSMPGFRWFCRASCSCLHLRCLIKCWFKLINSMCILLQ